MPPELRLHNSLTRAKEPLRPLEAGKVGLYCCGPTVYQYAHVGNLRTYVFEDLLRRTLESFGLKVRHVMNITDVGHLTSDADTGEDKMEVGARKEGKSAWEIAAFFTEAFFRDHRALNCLAPTDVTKATDFVSAPKERWDMLRLIQALEKRGLTYRISDGVYFDTSKFPGYERLVGKEHLEGLKAGARVEASPEKRHPSDFALWKLTPAGQKRQMEWDSPWGRGFPGWHVECSAMSMAKLGDTFDVHCGGVDHIPVHHTNELAQSEGATGKPFAKVWLHGEFLVLGGKAKMAKSKENFLTLEKLVEEGRARPQKRPYDPLAYRYLCLGTHYRKQLEFGWEALDGAQKGLDALRTHYWRVEQEAEGRREGAGGALEAFREALADDLNVPLALGQAWTAARDGAAPAARRLALLDEAEKVLGLDLAALARKPPPGELLPLLREREDARAGKDYKAADALRDRIGELGFYVEDTGKGPVLVRKT